MKYYNLYSNFYPNTETFYYCYCNPPKKSVTFPQKSGLFDMLVFPFNLQSNIGIFNEKSIHCRAVKSFFVCKNMKGYAAHS
jgi:hypothetical protein